MTATIARDALATVRAAFRKPRTASRHARSHHLFRDDDEVAELRRALLAFYDREQRTLPWRIHSLDAEGRVVVGDNDVDEVAGGQRAYEVWVSEIMLQQTQVATVIAYYNKWMAKWPTVFDLAKAELEDVNQVWSGLGYYSRAKRMLEVRFTLAARIVVAQFNGIFPKDPAALEKEIPGIGKYTAGAVSSIAYNVPAPLVDGNVIRFASPSFAPRTKIRKEFWQDCER
ncbi:hypothetical protein HK101_005236 [Irineochytrium annulatum]|nr:hypothetical protein HK101_005236 [Irineochytrium annulatum]